MLCDSCAKNKVCKYSEQCRILERDMNTRKLEDIISLTVNCKEYQSIVGNNPIHYRSPITSDKTWIYPYQTVSYGSDMSTIVSTIEPVTEFWSYDKPATYDSQKGKTK